jgi:uncharacterized protein YycO
MRPGDILLVRTATIWGWLIRLFTRSEWSHAAIYIGNGMVASIDAFQGVHIEPVPSERFIVLRYPLLTEKQAAGIVRWCYEQLGDRYDWGEIAEVFLRLVWGVQAVVDVKRRYICTVFTLEAFRAVDIDLAPGRHALTPGEMTNLSWLLPVDESQAAAV